MYAELSFSVAQGLAGTMLWSAQYIWMIMLKKRLIPGM